MTQNGIKTRSGKQPPVLTPGKEARNKRDAMLYKDYVRLLTEKPDRSITMLNDYLKEKYGFLSMSGYYAALRRGRTVCGTH